MRVYGGDAMAWLERTPIAVIDACLSRLPVIRAREALAFAEQVAVGTGSTKNGRETARQWARQAMAGVPAIKAQKATPEQLAGMGIKFEIVPPTKGTSDNG